MTLVGSLVTGDEAGRGIVDEIARDWATWSRTLGLIALPHLERLAEEIPSLTTAMLCTGDGLNIAALGVDDASIGRLAALSSSVFGVAGAHREVIDGPGAAGSTMVNIAGERSQTVLLRFDVALVGPLLLVLAAEDVGLGILIVAARSTSAELRSALEPPAPGTTEGTG